MSKPELLAPAKDLQTGIMAINCGADAVYIGAGKFGARLKAANNIEDIEKLLNYAHKYWAKVYVAVNTILTDEEIIEAQSLINKLYEIGADAVIIQDMGLLELDLPPIPIFASTQCHNNTPEKVDFLEKVGIQRVILPRELTLEQIKIIKAKTNVDLEFFVHGALCVCYSGQCYMSYASGKRSGNRGECAQPCRKKYTLIDTNGKILAKGKYLLSLKDLNLSQYLNDLTKAGISSLKIEGRLKDINYIKNIVSYYRHLIDNTTSEFPFNPDKTFNRGYSTYFLHGKQKDITAFDSPKHIGEPLGVIENALINNGDGITFFDKNGELQGTNDPNSIKKGTVVYKNHDHEYLKQLNNLKIERKIPITIEFTYKNLKLSDKNGNSIDYKIDQTFEPAENLEKARQTISKQLSKLGDTIFCAEKVELDLNPVPFIPVSILNEIRRQAIESLEGKRARNYPRKTHEIVKNNVPYPEKDLDYRANILNNYAKAFYESHGAIINEPAAESGLSMQGKKLMTTKHCLKYQFGLCGKPVDTLYLSDDKNQYTLKFDCENCEMHVY